MEELLWSLGNGRCMGRDARGEPLRRWSWRDKWLSDTGGDIRNVGDETDELQWPWKV